MCVKASAVQSFHRLRSQQGVQEILKVGLEHLKVLRFRQEDDQITDPTALVYPKLFLGLSILCDENTVACLSIFLLLLLSSESPVFSLPDEPWRKKDFLSGSEGACFLHYLSYKDTIFRKRICLLPCRSLISFKQTLEEPF